jgi:hypothetical protein
MFKKIKTYPAIDLFLQSHPVICFTSGAAEIHMYFLPMLIFEIHMEFHPHVRGIEGFPYFLCILTMANFIFHLTYKQGFI